MIKKLEDILQLINNEEEVILLFESRWCPICHLQKNILYEYFEPLKIKFYEVLVDEDENIRSYFKIHLTPLIQIYRNNKLKISLIGNHELEEIASIYPKEEYIEDN